MNEPKPSVTIAIQLEDDVAQGAYANLVLINHTETEFVLDFAFVQPQQPKAKVRSRVVLSPKQAARLIAALTENVGRYEKKFGNIGPVGTPDPSTTLVH